MMTQPIALTHDGIHLCLISPNPNNRGVVHYVRSADGQFTRKGRFATDQKVWLVSLFSMARNLWALTGTTKMGRDQVRLWEYDQHAQSWTKKQNLDEIPGLDTSAVSCLNAIPDGGLAGLLNGQGKVLLKITEDPEVRLSLGMIYPRRDRESSISMGMSPHNVPWDQVLLAGIPNSNEVGIFNYIGTGPSWIRHPAQGLAIGLPMLRVVPTAPFHNDAFFCVPKTGGVQKINITCRNGNGNPVLCLKSFPGNNFAKEEFGDQIQGISYGRFRGHHDVALMSNGEWAIYRNEQGSEKFNRLY
jgi:hypothetical protein